MSGAGRSQAEAALRALDRRRTIFDLDAEMFGDPAWTILLELYIARARGTRLSTTDAARASRASATTGLRHLLVLEERNYLERKPDPSDRRRSFMQLTDKAVNSIERWLKEI